ncbi:MAG TPA: hypothetical protein VNZ04_14775 [Trinickia sp.]|jgi:hypothetical protein|nr:hypothetical protein [Trinickia sp.]
MYLPKAAQSGRPVSAAAGGGRAGPDAEEQRRFRALFDEVALPEDSPCSRPGERHDERRRATGAGSRAGCAESIDCEDGLAALAPPGRFDTDELKVRLTNGPLAGSEVEAYRYGGHVSLHVRAASSTPLHCVEKPSAAKLAAELSKQLGLPVSVEYFDAPPAAT